jgi:hypothetical protein
LDFLMGEYGMAYEAARRTPPAELTALWRARERRAARMELRLLDDLFAVAGLQSEVRVEGERPKKGKRMTAVTLNQRREALRAEGYPERRKAYDPARDLAKIKAFWAAAEPEGVTVVAAGQASDA